MILLQKWKILTPLQQLPKDVGDLGKLIVAKALKICPKLQKIAQSGHTDCRYRKLAYISRDYFLLNRCHCIITTT